MSATAELASFASQTRFDDLPGAVVDECKRLIVDTFGCAVAATPLPAGGVVSDHAVTALGGPAASSVVGSSAKVGPSAAAYANCYLGTLVDGDETLMNTAHVGVCAIFPALAVCEANGRSGRDLLAAVAVGYDVGARVSLSLDFFSELPSGELEISRGNGLGYNVFAAAAAAGRGLDLDAEQMAMAVGIAGWSSPIAALPRWWTILRNRPMTKYGPYASMGMTGTSAAQLALAGLQGDPTFLDGDYGYWRLVGAPGCNWGALVDGLGDRWWVLDVSYKLYCGARMFHATVDAFRDLLARESLGADQVAEVDVATYFVGATDQLTAEYPATWLDGQFSIPFALALAAHGMALDPKWQIGDRFSDPRLRDLAGRVTIRNDPELSSMVLDDLRSGGRTRRQPSRVTVTTTDGRRVSNYVDQPYGDPWSERTRLTDDALVEKFRRFTDGCLSAADQSQLLELVAGLEDLTDLSSITAILARASR